MRCRKHLSDLSSSVGVCASCLRDRLFSLIDHQSKLPSQFQTNCDVPNTNFNRRQQLQQQQQKKQQQQPPPLIFPRSVSPYISRRKSEPIPRFYNTPQVNINPPTKKQNSAGKFGLISKLFRSRSTTSSTNSTTTSQNSSLTSHNSIVINCRNKGMSPDNEWEGNYEERETTESSPARWATRPSPARVRPSPARAASMAFCLSPLVRASPARHWGGGSGGGGGGEKMGFSGEIRAPASGRCKSSNNGNIESSNNSKPHLSGAASFCANRSRKLADFGRLKINR